MKGFLQAIHDQNLTPEVVMDALHDPDHPLHAVASELWEAREESTREESTRLITVVTRPIV